MSDVTLGITLKADGSNLVGQVKLSTDELDKLGKKGRQAGEEASRGTEAFGRGLSSVRNLLGQLGIALSVGAIVGFTRSVVDQVGALNDLSQQLQIDVERLQALNFEARETGAGASTLQQGLARLNEAIGEAAGGNKEVQQSFRDLGVAFVDANGKARSNADVLEDLARHYQEAGDKTQFIADLTDVMGRSAGRLVPILEQLGEGWEKFNQGALDAGQIISEHTVAALDDLGDVIEREKNEIIKFWAEAIEGAAKFLGIIDRPIDEQLGRINEELAQLNQEKATARGAGNKEDSYVQQLLDGKIAELKKTREGLLALRDASSAAADAAGGGTGSGGRATAIDTIDAETDSVTQLIAAMREEVELLGLSANAREEELAVRHAQDQAMAEGRLLQEDEIRDIRELIRQKQNMADADEAAADRAHSFVDALKEQKDATDDLGNAFSGLGRLGSNLFSNLRQGAQGLGDALDNLGEDLLDFGWNLLLSGLSNTLGGLDIRSLLGLGGTKAGPPPAGAGSGGPVNVAHEGGVLGRSRFPERRVPAGLFHGARHFTTGGIVGGEVPVIAHEGEVIGWPEQMRRAFGGSDVLVQVIDQRGRGAPVQTEQRQGPDGKRIIRVLIRDEMGGAIADGSLDNAMQAAYGVRRQGRNR